MSKLKANVENLQTATEKLKASSTELDQLKKEIMEIKVLVDSEWKGASAEAYKNLLNNYISIIDGIKKSVEELKQYSGDVGSQMEIYDKVLDFLSFFFPIINL